MSIGAAGGIALAHLAGLPTVAGAAIEIGAISVVINRLPKTSVLLATLSLLHDGLVVMPLVIVAVTAAHVVSGRLTPATVPATREAAARYLARAALVEQSRGDCDASSGVMLASTF